MSSAKMEEALLEGYEGPFFPSALEEMHQLMYGENPLHFNCRVLSEVAEVHGIECEIERLTTSDGYTWFWCLVMSTDSTSVIFALPWAQDWDMTGGTQSDRHSAVYAYGSVSDKVMNTYIAKFTEAMKSRVTENVV